MTKTNTHLDIAEAIIWLITIHKITNPNCKDNCYEETIKIIKAIAEAKYR